MLNHWRIKGVTSFNKGKDVNIIKSADGVIPRAWVIGKRQRGRQPWLLTSPSGWHWQDTPVCCLINSTAAQEGIITRTHTEAHACSRPAPANVALPGQTHPQPLIGCWQPAASLLLTVSETLLGNRAVEQLTPQTAAAAPITIWSTIWRHKKYNIITKIIQEGVQWVVEDKGYTTLFFVKSFLKTDAEFKK